MTERDMLAKVGRQHAKAVKIIGDFLSEMQPWKTAKDVEHNAAAILARLASADLLLASADELKE